MIVAKDYLDYVDKPLVGDGQCVKLVQDAMAKLYGPDTENSGQFNTSKWRADGKVKDALSILPGTLIATFDEDGKYPNKSTGNHAAIYLSRDQGGINVIDQWKSKTAIGKRKIKYKSAEEIKKEGAGYKMSNDGNCYYIIKI